MPYYTPPDASATDLLYSQAAAGYVQDLAPVPDPEPSDYADKAEAAEFLVYNYLKSTGGASVTSESRSGLSRSYASISEIAALIAPVMGEYYEGPQASSANTGYVEDFA
jgi:hypothetical protein